MKDMLLENCHVDDVDVVSAAPLGRTEPEEDWIQARDRGTIPTTVFALYKRAAFLSFGSAPSYLSDGDGRLFGYFSMVLRGLKSTLVDAHEALEGFERDQKQVYDIGKQFKGESWDKDADKRAMKHFKLLLISLSSTLDGIAELTAILLTGCISGLRVGKADFQTIDQWLKKPPVKLGLIVTPQAQKLQELYEKLKPIVDSDGAEKDWLPLMNLLRNKAAHLGTDQFRMIGFHDDEPRFYHFLPRKWPLLWEEHIKTQSSQKQHSSMKKISEDLIQEDVITFSRGLHHKVIHVVDSALSVLYSTYLQFENFALNEAALTELRKNSKQFDFKRFSK
jgi:hypothetical protein